MTYFYGVIKKWKYHLAVTLIAAIMTAAQELGTQGVDFFMKTLSNIGSKFWLSFYFCSVLVYILNYKFACPKFLVRKKIHWYILSFFGLILVFSGVRFLIEEVIIYSITCSHNYNFKNLTVHYYIFDNSYYALRALLYSTITYLIIQEMENRERVYRLEIDKKTAQTNALRAQLSPHFLFNTLNTFYSELIVKEPQIASSVQKLSELLRYVTHQSNQQRTTLKAEIKFIEDYIHFYKMRYETHLNVQFNCEGSIEEQEIPNMILIHFVENLFKHGVVNAKDKPAIISLKITDDELTLSTINHILSGDKYMESGIGTNNVRNRLQHLFPQRYSIISEKRADGTYFAELKMPFLHE